MENKHGIKKSRTPSFCIPVINHIANENNTISLNKILRQGVYTEWCYPPPPPPPSHTHTLTCLQRWESNNILYVIFEKKINIDLAWPGESCILSWINVCTISMHFISCCNPCESLTTCISHTIYNLIRLICKPSALSQ